MRLSANRPLNCACGLCGSLQLFKFAELNLRPAMLRLVPDCGHLQLLHQRMREAWAQWAGEGMESSKQLAQHFPCFKGLGKFVFHVRWWQVSEFPFLVDAFGFENQEAQVSDNQMKLQAPRKGLQWELSLRLLAATCLQNGG